MENIEQRLAELETKQSEINQGLEEIQEIVNQLKRKQIKEGPLGPLAKALAYHHEMEHWWTRLADEGGTYDELSVEFVRMREVLVNYEYVAQILLGINPSPFADLEDKKGHPHASTQQNP